MMKVLHVSPSFYPAYCYGGPIRSGYELCRNLALLGCDVRVLTTDANGLDSVLDVEKDREVCLGDQFQVRYCHRYLRHSVSPNMLRLLPQYIGWADLVHLTGVYNFPTFPTIAGSRLYRKPLVWSPRGALQRWEGSSRTTLKAIWNFICYSLADRASLTLHCTSQDEALQTASRLPGVHQAVIPNAVDVPSILNRTDAPECLRLLYIGRLDPKKGIDRLLKACSLMPQKNLQLTIAGSGVPSYVAHLRQEVDMLGLRGQVQMIGEVLADAKKKVFENSDVAVVPSHTENFAIVVAEALAHAVPVIASKGTPWSALERNGCGLWVENDPHTIADAILKISAMPLREMGRQGRVWMQNEFSWSAISTDMLMLYEKCLRESRAEAAARDCQIPQSH
jgi:glycosyltransferase involved in cell wall biosynthesis